MEIKFGSISIFELGQLISTKLRDGGITNQSELFIYVNDNDFKKIDEDLFYRNRKDESQEFIPSDEEIIINFELVKVVIKKYGI